MKHRVIIRLYLTENNLTRNARRRRTCNRPVTVALGFSVILLNLEMSAFMKWRRKKEKG